MSLNDYKRTERKKQVVEEDKAKIYRSMLFPHENWA